MVILLLATVSGSSQHEGYRSSETPEDQLAELKANVQYTLSSQAKLVKEMLTLLQDNNKKVEQASKAYK